MPPDKGWSRRFDEPVELPDGRKLRTLADAIAIRAKVDGSKVACALAVFRSSLLQKRGIAGMEVAEQSCAACGVERRIIHREWAPKGYEIQSLECPRCRTVMRMVRKRDGSKDA
jgi:hypothetical protein